MVPSGHLIGPIGFQLGPIGCLLGPSGLLLVLLIGTSGFLLGP